MNDIVSASAMPNTLKAALAYLKAGVSVIPLQGKRSFVSWEAYQKALPSDLQVMKWFINMNNVGVVCGQVSGNLVVIDLDGTIAIHRFKERFPSLMRTFSVKTGSGVGLHLYFYVDDLPDTARYMGKQGNVELRSNGCYVVAPPSKHPITGNIYYGCHTPVARLANLSNVIDWINRLKAYQPVPTPSRPSSRPSSASRWVQGAMENELQVVASANTGNRNHALFLGACRLGTLVHAGLDVQAVGDALFNSAVDNGLVKDDGADAVKKTILSGLRKGMATPRNIPGGA